MASKQSLVDQIRRLARDYEAMVEQAGSIENHVAEVTSKRDALMAEAKQLAGQLVVARTDVKAAQSKAKQILADAAESAEQAAQPEVHRSGRRP